MRWLILAFVVALFVALPVAWWFQPDSRSAACVNWTRYVDIRSEGRDSNGVLIPRQSNAPAFMSVETLDWYTKAYAVKKAACGG